MRDIVDTFWNQIDNKSSSALIVRGGVVFVKRASSWTVGSVTLVGTWLSLEGLGDQNKLLYIVG